MAKKTRTMQQQRARQEQWRRRVDSQAGPGAPTRPMPVTMPAASSASAAAMSDETDSVSDTVDSGENQGYQQAAMRQMPAVTTSAASTRSMSRTSGATATAMSSPTTSQRRAIAAGRSTRSKLAMNTLSLDDEMRFVRGDIRRLIILTVACLVIIIVLAFVLNR